MIISNYKNLLRMAASLPLAALGLMAAGNVQAEIQCTGYSETYTAKVVVLDTPMVFNRLGAQNPNWIIYALRRDVVDLYSGKPEGVDGTTLVAGQVALRPDKRPRPLTLRVPRCSKLVIEFENLLANPANPVQDLGDLEQRLEDQGLEDVNNREIGFPFVDAGGNDIIGDNQVKTRFAGVHVQGLQLASAGGIDNDSSYVGKNDNSCVAQGAGPTSFTFLAEHEGAFKLSNPCAAVGGEATGGNNGLGMWGMVAVQPKGARIYRSQVYEEEYRLAADANLNGIIDDLPDGTPGDEMLASGHPIIDYEARYPDSPPWSLEGKGDLPILNMIDSYTNEIVHSEINAIVAGPNADGKFPATTYPLEDAGLRNPAYPWRLEPFRDFASIFHDETATQGAFEGFFKHPVLSHTLHGVRDAFMINYGSGGIGAEIIANRLGVGPMYDCMGCAYEEFFLTSFTVGDPGMRVDVPANFGLENIAPEDIAAADLATLAPLVGPKATTAMFQDDPANIHNSYTGDHAKVRNIHAGPKEQHIFHQHNHQWLFNANDDRANYLDAQGIGPGSSYTYEYVYGGMGNRNRTAGDAIFHCHFYPHFAQGMWYHMRIHDVTETGTILEASVTSDKHGDYGYGHLNGLYHDDPFELGMSPPALVVDTNTAGLTNVNTAALGGGFDPLTTRNRAHPDAEILAGVPISAVVPLPAKAMAPMPGDVVLVTKDADSNGVDDSSQNYVVERNVNPGYPFWIAGIDCSDGVSGTFDPGCANAVVGQRPTTPPLDMITQAEAADLIANDPDYTSMPLPPNVTQQEYETAFVNAAGGFDGGLPRYAIEGCKGSAASPVPGCPAVPHLIPELGELFASAETRLDFHKEVIKAKGVFYPEGGTDLEKVAMAFHATRNHPSTKLNLDGTTSAGNFVLNGLPPVPGAPYNDPCVSDTGQALVGGGSFNFFGSGLPGAGGDEYFPGPIAAGRAWDEPFTYAAANIQIDAVFNKVGYHYPQQRIIALWGDVFDMINKAKAPEPFVMRLNSFNCAKYQHSNLVPKEFEVDDYQVRTPTDIIGQHIHLPKWDLTTADGAANGWNYEDGTLSPGMVVERIHAINKFDDLADDGILNDSAGNLAEQPHPALGAGVGGEWKGGRVTLQRWFADPLVDRDEIDRGLGLVFTHDHYGPSTFQQIGLYSTLLTEPAESTWVHNETGTLLGSRQASCGEAADGLACDGGPTSWQAAILPPENPTGALADVLGEQEPFREFYFEYNDFQHAYEAGVYVGAGPDGRPFTGGAGHPSHDANGINTAFPVTANSFRHAINPSRRQQAVCKGPNCPAGGSPFPDIVRWPAVCDVVGTPRPCPEAINADDAGFLTVNYRHEPVGLRVFDPFALGPDDQPGTQTAGFGGDLAFALATPPLLGPDGATPVAGQPPANAFRAIPQMNAQPVAGAAGALAVGVEGFYVNNECPGCTIIPTEFPDSEGITPYNTQAPLIGGDPYTPMMRTFPGDLVTVKIQTGAHEHEHNKTIHGVKWVQGNSGHGPERPAGGWRGSQNGGISEQFNYRAPINSDPQAKQPFQFDPLRGADHLYTVDASQNGMWSGVWGLMRSYTGGTPNSAPLYQLPGGFTKAPRIDNRGDFNGVCPDDAPLREYVVIADTANKILDNVLVGGAGVTITGGLPDAADVLHVGGQLDDQGGTLVYNPREKDIPGNAIGQPNLRQGPLHDPTALMFVLAEDLEPDPAAGNQGGACNDVTRGQNQRPGVANPACQVRLKPEAPVEPIVLRAAAGECVEVRLFNRLTDVNPDLAGFNTLLPMVIRDRQAEPQPGEPANSVTGFNNNLIRASSYVGLHAQMVEYDITQHSGVVTGGNVAGGAVVGPAQGGRLAGAPFNAVTYRWYAGHVQATRTGSGRQERVRLDATPVEFGGSNLTPADRIKQTQKGMIGALVIEPEYATWANSDGASDDDLALLEQVPNRQDNGATTRGTRADMVVTAPGGSFHDHVLMKQSGMNHRLRDGEAVPNIASEGQGIPEDAHDAGQKGVNFASEPAWFRFGIQPDANFGNAGAGPQTLGGVDGEKMFSNVLNGDGPDPGAADDDPWTPVFTATPGEEVRVRLLNPAGVGRGSTYDLHGHVWARDPYLPEDETCLTAMNGLGWGKPLNAGGSAGECGLSSVKIGDNPLAWYLNGQESWTPMAHFDIVVEAGGLNAVEGDYLYRDHASFGVTDGIWGIMRVE
jgi:hypothetical protein